MPITDEYILKIELARDGLDRMFLEEPDPIKSSRIKIEVNRLNRLIQSIQENKNDDSLTVDEIRKHMKTADAIISSIQMYFIDRKDGF